MGKTVVFIGKFSDELNSLKEAIGTIDAGLRFISFLEAENALMMLMKDNVLFPDFLVLDESFPFINFPLLKTLKNSSLKENIPIILFIRSNSTAQGNLPSQVFILRKSTSKKDYTRNLKQIFHDPDGFAITTA